MKEEAEERDGGVDVWATRGDTAADSSSPFSQPAPGGSEPGHLGVGRGGGGAHFRNRPFFTRILRIRAETTRMVYPFGGKNSIA